MNPVDALISWRVAVHGAREQQHRNWFALETVITRAIAGAVDGNPVAVKQALALAEGIEYDLVGNCEACAQLRQTLGVAE